MIAHRWNVSQWSAHSVGGGGLVTLDDETAQSGFHFLFDHLDESTMRFVYKADGSFIYHTSLENPACIGSGSGTALHSPWADPSSLALSYDVTRYAASLDMSREAKVSFTITCNPGGQRQTTSGS